LNQPPVASFWFTGVAHALPVILDADEKPAVLLHDAYNIMIYEELQSEDRLEFAIPGPGPPELKVSAVLDLAGRYYRVIRIRNLEDEGIRTLRIEAWALWYDLAKMPELPKIKWSNTTIAEILEFLMPGSGWSPSAIGIAERRNLTWDGGTNRLECLREIERVFNAEIVWNTAARVFSVLVSGGVETGVWFLRGRSLKKFEVESDFRDTVHRVYPRGKDGLTIASVNDGVPYLEIPTTINPPPSRVLLAEEFTDPAQLKLWAQAEFSKIKEAKVVYECEILDLSAFPGYSEEKIRVGDIVEVYDEETDTGLKARIVRLQYNVEKPWESKVEIASAHQDIAGEIRALQQDISLVGARYAEEVSRLDTRIDPTTSHIFRIDNPHNVTAAQIGIVLPAKVFLLLPGGAAVLPSTQGGAEVTQVDAAAFPYLVVDFSAGGTRTAHWQGNTRGRFFRVLFLLLPSS